jgi:hypothetical protein
VATFARFGTAHRLRSHKNKDAIVHPPAAKRAELQAIFKIGSIAANCQPFRRRGSKTSQDRRLQA